MNLLKRIFKKRAAPVVPKSSAYSFSVTEIAAVGDKYVYRVQGDNRDDAFAKLVEYFYGTTGEPDVESDHFTVLNPSGDRFHTNMPMWFARVISDTYGPYRQELAKQDRQKLEEFAKLHNITLKS